MGWEARKGTDNAYYTRSRRVDGRVVREYFGNGPRGREAARRCEQVRMLREQERDHESQRMLIMAECERLCLAFYEFVDLVLDCEMLVAGYHYHRGEWRKRRVPKEKPGEAQPVAGNATASAKPPESRYPERSHQQPEPRRRPMPQRRPLDCRLGLVRGIVAFRSAKGRAFAERKTTILDAHVFHNERLSDKRIATLTTAPRDGCRVRAPPTESTAGQASSGTQQQWQITSKQ